MNLAFRGTRNRHRADTVDTRQRVGDIVIKNLVKARHALVCLNREKADRNHVGGELEDNRVFRIIGKLRFYHVEFVAHIVSEDIYVIAIFEFKSDHGCVLP